MTTKVFSIPPGIYCVPATMCALTGLDLTGQIMPAIAKAEQNESLLGVAAGVYIRDFERAMGYLGYSIHVHKTAGSDNKQLRTWAGLSAEKYPGKRLAVSTRGHMMALVDGKVYDTFTPYGEIGAKHPYARDIVKYVSLIERK